MQKFVLKEVSIFSHYLQKYGILLPVKDDFPSFCPEIMVVIPCFDEGDITGVLNAIMQSYDYNPIPTCVVVVINAPEDSPIHILQNNLISKACVENQQIKCKTRPDLFYVAIEVNALPRKDAGVGMARKIGMDIAISIFMERKRDGVIACLDADSLCQKNYLCSLVKGFSMHKDWDAASIYFEHPLDKVEYTPRVIDAIIQYELHLRVFVGFQRWLELPYAIQTIGSSMAVRATSYCMQGGMNKKKAGEDFYFLHKIGDKGKVGFINSTVVIPSPRISHRVPFGTGKAISNVVEEGKEIRTYHPDTFKQLKIFMDKVKDIYYIGWTDVKPYLSPVVTAYFESIKIESFIVECKKNSPNLATFLKRFFQWFNAFKLMKYCHFCRENGLHDVTPLAGFNELNTLLGKTICQDVELDAQKALYAMRVYDKS